MTPPTPYDGATKALLPRSGKTPTQFRAGTNSRQIIRQNENGGGLSTAATLIRNASVSPAGAPRTRLWGWTLRGVPSRISMRHE